MLDDPLLLGDVAHDELAAALMLRGIAAVAWIKGGSRDVFRKLGYMPLLPRLEALRDETLLDLDVGETARVPPPVPPHRNDDGSLLEPDEPAENPGLVRRVFDWFNQLPFTR